MIHQSHSADSTHSNKIALNHPTPTANATYRKRPSACRILALVSIITMATGWTTSLAQASPVDNQKENSSLTLEHMAADHLSRIYGLSASEAMDRVHDQESHARMALIMAKKLGDRSPGSFIDQKNGKLVVNVADEKAATMVSGGKVKPRIVGTTASQLAHDRVQAERRLGQMMRSSAVDPMRNMVTLSVPAENLEAARKAVTDLSRVEVQESAHDVEPLAIAKPDAGGPSPVRGGDKIDYKMANGNGYSCSYGFSVTKGGQEGFITAGHCADKDRAFTREGKNLGTTQQFSFPGEDMAYSTLDTKHWTGEPSVNKMEKSENIPVKGSTEAAVGAAVCKSGLVTKWTCGTIKAKNVTSVNNPNDPKARHEIKGLTETDACARVGDSGGPWMSGNQAQGITSSGNATHMSNGKCQNSRGDKIKTYFQPINPILQKYGLTLKVSK
ncbi:S1 family peptidase [Austwickia chelonae]|uniref:S1 family peptidase n=1 Tax=Austwickia chelonae TaxID=100225 RepID=UPI0013C2ED52|nr:S1 family peptidase [Austwickia chelonae]